MKPAARIGIVVDEGPERGRRTGRTSPRPSSHPGMTRSDPPRPRTASDRRESAPDARSCQSRSRATFPSPRRSRRRPQSRGSSSRADRRGRARGAERSRRERACQNDGRMTRAGGAGFSVCGGLKASLGASSALTGAQRPTRSGSAAHIIEAGQRRFISRRSGQFEELEDGPDSVCRADVPRRHLREKQRDVQRPGSNGQGDAWRGEQRAGSLDEVTGCRRPQLLGRRPHARRTAPEAGDSL